ncbi:hypothetical protein L6452_14483 [Arctium lappa]|uniref:Uncharacterized protein n=1 Tax=Arctium lappa TaxID=4217 RepID=A0ACB9CL12_ARCLA|nr:hypothetical protein L6452_14483 [Arctium lappa]
MTIPSSTSMAYLLDLTPSSNRLITRIQFTSNTLCEIPISIAQQHHLILYLQIGLPCLHHESVVDRDTRDCVDTLRFEVAGFSTNPGRCFWEQARVKAPGTANMIAFLDLVISEMVAIL